jgi:ribosome maturation factor RimP
MKSLRLFLIVVVVLSAAPAFARVWTDKHGKQTQGKLVRYFDGDVVLLRGTKAVTIPFADLSDNDQEYVRKELAKKGQANLLPPDPREAEVRLPEPAEERTWTSNDGKKIQARLVAVSNKKVTILFKGKEVSLPLKRLSQSDQQYAKEEQRKRQDNVAQPGAGQLAGMPKPSFSPPGMLPGQMPNTFPPQVPQAPFLPPPTQPDPMPAIPASNVPSTPPSFGPSPGTTPPHFGPGPSERPNPNPFPRPNPNPFPQPASDVASQTPQPGQQEGMTKQCMNCKAYLPNSTQVGDKCPHCGVFFEVEEDESGRVIKRAPLGKYAFYGGGIPSLAVLIGLLLRWLKRD